MKLCPKCGKHFSDDANFCPVDAARLVPLDGQAATETADALSARFELGDRLGGASTGEVRRATDKQTNQPAVVKIIAPAVMALPQVAQRIERELKQLERVESPSVAKVLASGKRGDSAWVGTEYVDAAQTLSQVLSARGPMVPAQAAELVATIGEALIEAAKVGVVHRDLAPKNILLAGGDPARIKLINFCAPMPTSDRAPGVAEYTAPEVIEGKQLDQRSNIYSLGAIYYHALTGSPPFGGDTSAVHAAHLAGSPEAPSKRIAAPPELDALILRALERNPAKRYLTVRQFVDEVQRVAKGGDAGGTQRLGGSGMATGKQKPKEAVQTLMGVPPADGKRAPEPVIELTPKAPAPVPSTMAGVAPSALGASPASRPPASMAPTVPTPVVATAPAPGPQPSTLAGPGSPWAPPAEPGAGGGAFAPAAAAQAAAAPAVGAIASQVPTVMAPPPPVMPAAPVMPSAPVMPTGPAAGGKGKASTTPPEDKSSKGKFRETMWFKKGELDAAAAEAAAEEAARTGKATVPDKADSLPMEDRYKDDGTINRQDRDKYSLKTGDTTMMPAVKVPGEVGDGNVSANELVGEMKKGRNLALIVIFLVFAAGAAVAVYFLTK